MFSWFLLNERSGKNYEIILSSIGAQCMPQPTSLTQCQLNLPHHMPRLTSH